ncbi:MAG: protein-L-isoaspartate(D-aspartate) O-methyltransferase [Chlorobi bacterium]|nr:protein-L-isoaspartate(D-aspartate) O-methyltransferase [Chlorobiota bacterium]
MDLFIGPRKRLVEHLREKGISDERVLKAIEKVPRHLFVPETTQAYAYDDTALPIGYGQTISQPYTVAFMLEKLNVEPGHKVLDVGTGSGYQAALLSELGADVYSIERIYPLYEEAKERLANLGYDNVKVFYRDGWIGLPEYAPYDRIIVAAAAPQTPEKLLKQLKIGGIMIIPIGDEYFQKLVRIKRIGENEYEKEDLGPFVFVPLKKGKE